MHIDKQPKGAKNYNISSLKVLFLLPSKTDPPFTLGEKLTPKTDKPHLGFAKIILVACSLGLLVGMATHMPIVGAGVAILSAVMLLALNRRKTRSDNLLLNFDRQGFMKHLRLADKTALFDGNNIYHFGIKNGIGTTALWALVNTLRSEGYRIVCFFDANIYFTLRENSELKDPRERFSVLVLKEIFDLKPDEIYVVPSGHQADAFIVETLSVLPISFVVTNDRFRDYEGAHGFLAKDTQWRKGVEIKQGELRLFQHKFKRRLKV
ncbi:MAG: hypothetical protein KUG74_14950 [Rhodobacteraceae bacterium]|nr:hypothetical protein [Paracoccaceae bacterium]